MGLTAKLDLLARDGKASILAQPQLSARNGSKAEFLAGGEYPYSVATIYGPVVMFKPYGVKLRITPRVDRNGVIRAEIDSEVSNIDPSFSTPSGPGLSTRRTFTEFNVQDGETMVLAGLLSRKGGDNVDKVPFLGDLPVLGALFRSQRFQNEETELVVFVTPTVINSRSPGLLQRVEDAGARLGQRYGPQPYLTEPGPAPEHPPGWRPCLWPAQAPASRRLCRNSPRQCGPCPHRPPRPCPNTGPPCRTPATRWPPRQQRTSRWSTTGAWCMTGWPCMPNLGRKATPCCNWAKAVSCVPHPVHLPPTTRTPAGARWRSQP